MAIEVFSWEEATQLFSTAQCIGEESEERDRKEGEESVLLPCKPFYKGSVLGSALTKGSALTVGSFDGPHLGHKALFRTVYEGAKRLNIVPGVVTFRESVTRFKDNAYKGDISTLDERLKCFEKYGLKFAVVIDFSVQFARIEGSVFFDTLVTRLGCRFIAEGEDFHCGRGGAFTRREIEAFCAVHSVECVFTPPVMAAGEKVTSQRIRRALAEGDTETAMIMLGEATCCRSEAECIEGRSPRGW